MKRIVYILTAAVALVAVSAACSKVTPVDDNPAAKTMTIKVTLSDAATRVTFDPTYGSDFKPTKMAHTWEAGDQLRITDAADASKTAVFDLVDGVGTATGTFEGAGFEAASYNVEAIPTGTFLTEGDQVQAKDGATDHLKFVAAATGVTDLTNFTLDETSGILAIIAKLPENVAGTIDEVKVELSLGAYSFPAVSVSLTAQEDVDSDDVLKVYANVPASFAIPAGVQAFLKFGSTNPAHTVYTRYLDLSVLGSMAEGQFNYIKLNCSHIDQYAGGADDGMEENPYLIADKYQMRAMSSLMAENETVYFKLLADIDLENEEWIPLNYSGSFGKGIYFDGNGHTIKNLTSTSAHGYPSFVGVLNGTVKNLTFDGATITAGNNTAGVLAGYAGSSSSSVVGSFSGITVKNATVTGSKRRLAGLVGYAEVVSGTINDCHVINTSVTSGSDRVGGLIGEVAKGVPATNCTAENVTVSGTINIGGLIGVGYGNVTDCTSSGSILSTNTTSNADIGLGGLVGYLEHGTISHCSSSVNIDQKTNGRDIGGLVGKMLAAKVEKSFATGNVKGMQRNVGGLIGLITLTSGTATVTDSYCTGNVVGNAYTGGFLGLHEKGTVNITNCYASGSVNGAFGLGGMVGFMGANSFTMNNSAAWNDAVNPTSHGQTNWSSGAVVGVTQPNCVITNVFRNPDMTLTVYCPPPTADWNHPDIDGTTTPLYQNSQTAPFTWGYATGTAASAGTDNVDAGRWAYHGKVELGKTLSQLASTTLGWSSSVWDFSGELPVLK